MRTIISTVGTSLLNNAKRVLQEERPNRDELVGFLCSTDPVQASAETNSLSRLLRLDKPDDRLVFLCSQTEEGKLCAEALKAFYRRRGYDGEVVEIPGLTYREERFKVRGLRSLVAALIENIRREKKHGREVLLNATGGFKAEIAYATLVGLLFDVPVYYIHEAFSDIIEMPPAPVSWDYSLLADCEEFFEWMQEGLRATPEVDARLRDLPPEVRLLLAEEEGFTMLSPAGEAFYEAYKEQLAQAAGVHVFLSSSARKTYESAAPATRRLFDRALEKVRVWGLRLKARRVNNSDCLVYPRGPRDERVFFYEAEDGSIMVCELARKSDGSYERMLRRGVWRANYKDFKEWEGGRG